VTQPRTGKVPAADEQAESKYSIAVRAPYRLDLTVSVLRRLSTNLVDLLTPDGEYVRLLGNAAEPVVIRARQPNPGTLTVEIEADPREHPRLLALARRMLGVEVDLTRFYRLAADIQWLHPLVLRMRGVRPPRYPTVWEACVNAIVFQQLSLHAASAIMGRLIGALGEPVESRGVRLHRFPSIGQLQGAADSLLLRAGLSTGKLATLRRVVDAIGAGALDEAQLEKLPTPDAGALLRSIKGIGQWTAAVILLRGLGRLDVFPANDTSVARNLTLVGGPAPLDVETLLDTLGPERGMLYYHLLLGRLETRGDLGPSAVDHRQVAEPSGT
jgi:DNA-3-methyladenine glycosylase II